MEKQIFALVFYRARDYRKHRSRVLMAAVLLDALRQRNVWMEMHRRGA